MINRRLGKAQKLIQSTMINRSLSKAQKLIQSTMINHSLSKARESFGCNSSHSIQALQLRIKAQA